MLMPHTGFGHERSGLDLAGVSLDSYSPEGTPSGIWATGVRGSSSNLDREAPGGVTGPVKR
jgi:hypothetical protein